MTSFRLAVNIPREILNKVCNTTIAVFAMLAMLFISSCKDDPVPTSEENYKLAGTRWTLIAFVDVENNTSNAPNNTGAVDDYDGNEYFFSLIFFTDTICIGYAGINSFGGGYSIDSNINNNGILSLKDMGVYTEAMDDEDGWLYVKILFNWDVFAPNFLPTLKNKTFNFSVVTAAEPVQLKLFYDDGKKYLLFKRNDFKLPWEEQE